MLDLVTDNRPKIVNVFDEYSLNELYDMFYSAFGKAISHEIAMIIEIRESA